MEIGDRIKEARKRAGLTQKELGQKLGISYQLVGQYENGVRNPKFETLCTIANALGVPVGGLIESLSIGIMTEDDVKAFEYFREHPEEDDYDQETKLSIAFNKLNALGRDKAIEQVELLTKIPDYQKEK